MQTLDQVIAMFNQINADLAEDPDAGGIALKACNVAYYQDQVDFMVQDYGLTQELGDAFIAWLAQQS